MLICRWVLPGWAYVKLNRFVMSILFFIPLTLIALFESQMANTRSGKLQAYFAGPIPEEEGDPKVEDPGSDDPNGEISKVSFAELIKVFPK